MQFSGIYSFTSVLPLVYPEEQQISFEAVKAGAEFYPSADGSRQFLQTHRNSWAEINGPGLKMGWQSLSQVLVRLLVLSDFEEELQIHTAVMMVW